MELNTAHLGTINFDKENIIKFDEGLPGFENEKEFIIVLSQDEQLPFHYLQSVTSPEIAFLITNPFAFVDPYDFEISEETLDKLAINNPSEVSVYSITTIPEDLEKTSINLAAPVVINNANKKGKQIILTDNPYIKYYIFASDEKGEATC